MRRLSVKEVAVCVVGGALTGFSHRPRYARIPPAFLPPDEIGPAIACTLGGVVVVLGGYVFLIWRKGW